MRILAILAVLSLDTFAADSPVRPLSATEFRDLAKQCLPDAPLSTLRAIAKVESAYNPLAISINYPEKASTSLGFDEGVLELSRQPASIREAVQWTKWFYARGLTVSIGLMQVNAEHLPALGLSLEQAFEPCANLKAGWTILNAKYRAAAAVIGKGQLALHAAISSYNSGSPTAGFNNGYVENVLDATTPASSIPPFGGLTVKPQSALVPQREYPQSIPPLQDTAQDDPNSAPTQVSWSSKVK